MPAPTRYTNGVATVRKSDVLGYFGMPDPTEFHVYFNDFDEMPAIAAAATDTDTWDVTLTEAGAGEGAIALADGDGGLITLTNDDADNDAIYLQKKGESFKFAVGKKLWFKSRFKISDATQSDFVVGLLITDTTPLDTTDGVYFRKDDGDANIDFGVEKDNTATTALAAATVVADTFMVLAFYYNGVDKIHYFKDGVELGYSAVTNLPDDEELTVTFGIQNGEAVAKVMTMDYIFVAKER